MLKRKAVIAIPSKQVLAAGGHELKFESIQECARFFEANPSYIFKKLYEPGKRDYPYKGFYLDFLE